jgi:hypothetical protein
MSGEFVMQQAHAEAYLKGCKAAYRMYAKKIGHIPVDLKRTMVEQITIINAPKPALAQGYPKEYFKGIDAVRKSN